MANPCPHRFRPGDRVVQHPHVWPFAPAADWWTQDLGVGVVLELPECWRGVDDWREWVDVRWPSGRLACRPHHLLPAPTQPPAASS